MRSKTSFFNPTIFLKNVTRFWPLWTAYTLIWLMSFPLRGLNQLRRGWWEYAGSNYGGFHEELAHSMRSESLVMAVVFGILFAMALFSYLYQGRSACMFHSLPVRREGLFLTNYLSGVAFFLIPNTLTALLTLLVELAAGDVMPGVVGLWWLVTNGICLFFFSFAVFCAMFTGHILALPVFYGILNGLVLGVSILVSELLGQSMYGFNGFSSDTLQEILTPAWGINVAVYSRWENGVVRIDEPLKFALYVLAGLVFAALALLLYRRRQMESAGDVVSVPWVRPVFKYGVALCSGLALGMLTYGTVGLSGQLSLWVCMLLWTVIGCFAAEMLLKKSFRVFRTGWKGALAAACAVVVFFAIVELDLLGYEDRVPQVGQVEGVRLSRLDSAPYDNGSWCEMELDDPEQVAKVIALHQAYVDQKDRDRGFIATDDIVSTYVSVRLDYTLAGGGHLRRSYNLPVYSDELNTPGTVAWAAQRLLDDRTVVNGAYRLEGLVGYTAEQVELTEADGTYGTALVAEGDDAQRVWQAVRKDFEEGGLGRRYLMDTEERMQHCYFNDLQIYLTQMKTNEKGEYYTSGSNFTVTLTPEATHTLAVLEELGALDRVELVTYGDKISRNSEDRVKYPYPETAVVWEG